MKNFDFPYINDSPVDLSGIEGADKPTDLSGIHDGATCECEMCVWANRQEREMLREEAVCQDIDQVLMSLSPFALAWATAPEMRRKYIEQDDAAFWYGLGRSDEQKSVENDLREMSRLVEGRMK